MNGAYAAYAQMLPICNPHIHDSNAFHFITVKRSRQSRVQHEKSETKTIIYLMNNWLCYCASTWTDIAPYAHWINSLIDLVALTRNARFRWCNTSSPPPLPPLFLRLRLLDRLNSFPYLFYVIHVSDLSCTYLHQS